MKQNKREFFIIVGSVALTGAVVYAFYQLVIQKPKKVAMIQAVNDILDAKVPDPNAPAGQVVLSSAALSALPAGSFPLKVGDANQKVYALEQALNKNYGTTLDLDGKFGQGLYKVLCDKYFDYGCSVFGVPVYTRHIESTDMDQINNHKN